jgi:N-acetylneuraminate synthase
VTHGATTAVNIANRLVGEGAPVFIVAEVGSNHNADLAVARELVKRAASAGATAVKFQLFRAESLYPANAGVVEMAGGRADLWETFSEFALPAEWLHELRELADEEGLVFLCTAFDEETLNALAALEVSATKIASPELNHLPLLRSAARLRRPLICSTGLATLADIDEALATVRDEWSDAAVVLLQCVSAYPLPAEESNLRVIDTLRRAFGVPVGLSDHTIEPVRTAAIASAVGACLIEKHMTLDRSMRGPDHASSIEPDDFARLVETVRQLDELDVSERMALVRSAYGDNAVEGILGGGCKTIQPSERSLYPGDKRSIHALRDIDTGETLSPENVRVLRSERNLSVGLHPRYWKTVCGAVTTAAISRGEGVTWEALLQRPS